MSDECSRFSQYCNIVLTGGKEHDDNSPGNPVELIFKDGVDNVKIEQVLSEQECISACKWGNEKLEKL
jgi:hypothetical protein